MQIIDILLSKKTDIMALIFQKQRVGAVHSD